MEKPDAIILVKSYLLVGVASPQENRAIPVREYYRNRSRQLLPKFDSLSPEAVPTAGYAYGRLRQRQRQRADCYTVHSGNAERIMYALVSSGLTQR